MLFAVVPVVHQGLYFMVHFRRYRIKNRGKSLWAFHLGRKYRSFSGGEGNKEPLIEEWEEYGGNQNASNTLLDRQQNYSSIND